jgi:hypothetical protein
MKPASKNTIAVICVVALIGAAAWLYLWQLTGECTRSDEEKSKTIKALRADWGRATNENLHYRHRIDEIRDTVMGLTLEKGIVEIELNRKTEELKQANARYKSSRQVKDTARALVICDSIVYTYLPDYFTVDSSYGLAVDTLQTFTDKWVNGLADSVIKVSDQLVKNLGTQIDQKTEEQKQDRKEGKRRKGELLKVGIFGAAVGVLIALIFGG